MSVEVSITEGPLRAGPQSNAPIADTVDADTNRSEVRSEKRPKVPRVISSQLKETEWHFVKPPRRLC